IAAVGYVSVDNYTGPNSLASSVATVGLSVGHRLWVDVDGTMHLYVLRASTNNTPPMWVRPNDYDSVTNAKAWVLASGRLDSLQPLAGIDADLVYSAATVEAGTEVIAPALTTTDGLIQMGSGGTATSLSSAGTGLYFITLPGRSGTLVTLNGDQTFAN